MLHGVFFTASADNITSTELETEFDITTNSITSVSLIEIDDNENLDLSNEANLSNYPTDPGLWTKITNDFRNFWIQNGPEKCNNCDSDYKETKITYLENNIVRHRYLSKSVFQRKLKNGECVTRDWVIYSPEKKNDLLFCMQIVFKFEYTIYFRF